jgi:hypothetical protein
MQGQRASRRTQTGDARRPWRATWLGVLAMALALVVAPAAAMAQGTQAVIPGSQGEGPAAKCFWGPGEINVGPLDEPNETYPYRGLAPDTNTDYYATTFKLAPGATVTLHGQFPYSRFFSLTTYKNLNGEPGIPADSVLDENIAPDPGSVNPFKAGENREASNRSFTITVSGAVEPAEPAPNTLYVGQEGHTEETQNVEIIERIYRADRGLEGNGGVPLPTPTYNPVEGSPVSNESEACSDLSVVSGVESLNETKFGVPAAQYKALRSGLPGTKEPATHPAVNPIRWEKFFNSGYLVAPFYDGTAYESMVAGLSSTPTSGLYATPANAYAIGYASRLFGPNAEGHNILVLHAKMPTHPQTYNGSSVSEDGTTQVRYWSLCNYTGISKSALLAANSGCLFDQDIPTNAKGEYTIVVSLPEDRPANARPGCGVAWMNWGTAGDGEGRPDLDLLMMRNQVSNPTFAQSIANVAHPGEEEAVMGAYYPHGTYTDKEQYESSSSCEAAAPGTPHLTSGSSPNQGAFTLGWTPAGEAENVEGVTYTLQHKETGGSWSTVASGLTSPEYTFAASSPEAEGTWTYRVEANGEATSAYSSESGAVLVDRTPPSLSMTCPATAELLASGVDATVVASDGQSGLAQNPSGSVPISTSSLGEKTITKTAIDNAGNETTRSCSTDVVYAFSAFKPGSGKKVAAGDTAVTFKLKDALGYVTDGSATLEIAPIVGGVTGSYHAATSATNAGDAFEAEKSGKYAYSLNTSGLAANTMWSLRVNVNDGTTHTTSITIKK